MAVISVSTYSAIPNDGIDDSYQIQRAIDSAAPGDTISFGSGTYNVGRTLDPRGGGRIFQGNGATLQGGSSNYIFHFQGTGLTITGFHFDGQGIFFDNNAGSMVSNVTIDNNTFSNNIGGVESNSIYFTTGLRNTEDHQQLFHPDPRQQRDLRVLLDHLTIANNAFMDGNEGIHIVDHSNSGQSLLIEQNYFSGLHRMGIEYQGGGWNTTVQDNYYENPVLTSDVNKNLDTFAYSIVADRSVNTVVHDRIREGVQVLVHVGSKDRILVVVVLNRRVPAAALVLDAHAMQAGEIVLFDEQALAGIGVVQRCECLRCHP